MPFVYRRDYPKNKRWRAFTKEQLRLRSVCEECRKAKAVELHHRYYYINGISILGLETARDVTAICRNCHEELHRDLARIRRKKKRLFGIF